jgi:hypothetical protein
MLRAYENEELPEKKHIVWCTSFFNLFETKNDKIVPIGPTKALIRT